VQNDNDKLAITFDEFRNDATTKCNLISGGMKCTIRDAEPLNSDKVTVVFTLIAGTHAGSPIPVEFTAAIISETFDVDETNNNAAATMYLNEPAPITQSGITTTDIIIIAIVSGIMGYILVNAAIVAYHAKFFTRDRPPEEEDFEEAGLEELE
jgi:hypothetical protein